MRSSANAEIACICHHYAVQG